MLFPGPISSILVNRYGSRPVVIFGGLLCGIGMVSAAFCTSILQLYICVGFITGKKKASPLDSHLKFTSDGLGILSQRQWEPGGIRSCQDRGSNWLTAPDEL